MPYDVGGTVIYYYGDSELEADTDLRSKHGVPQKYSEIFQECKTSGQPFIDPEFPHEDASVGNIEKLFDTANPDMAEWVADWKAHGWDDTAAWIRISELCEKLYHGENKPCFNCGDIGTVVGRNVVEQGQTGDCWFLCAISAISMQNQLITFVVPADNETNDAGVYHFRYWYQGAWVDIVVDDYVPYLNMKDEYNLVGSRFHVSNGKAEFWAMLLEKAYAKLNGSYYNIAGNWSIYALENMSGGLGEFVDFDDDGGAPPNLFKDIVNWIDKNSVVCAGTTQSRKGVVGNHAYSMTGAKVLTYTGDDGNETSVELVRMRNPWGNSEWTGDWSDKSSLWEKVSEEEKKAIGFKISDDGEFWMSYKDFVKTYENVSAVYFLNTKELNAVGSKVQFVQYYDNWNASNGTSGGWGEPWNNPHYTVELSSDTPGGKCVLVTGTLVEQKLKIDMDFNFGIRVFPTADATTFDEEFFRSNADNEKFPIDTTKAPVTAKFTNSLGFLLEPGKYVIIPTTLESDITKKICVRILNQGTLPARQAQKMGRSGADSPGSCERCYTEDETPSGSESELDSCPEEVEEIPHPESELDSCPEEAEEIPHP